MTPLRTRFIEDLQLWNRSENTIRAYVRAVRQLAEFYGKSPDKISREQVREYLLYLVRERRVSRSTYNVALSAIRFLFHRTLKREAILAGIPCPRGPQKLPVVLSLEEMFQFFGAIHNIKHRATLMTAYDAGLRVSEVISLRLEDIDSQRMVIHVRNGKGRKERYVNLSERLLVVLREYWKACKPRTWLFPGKIPGRHICSCSIYRVCGQACQRAGLKKQASTHTMRHSYATHLLDAGTNLRVLQILLGHKSIRTTATYTHVSKEALKAAPSALDLMHKQLGGRKGA